MDYQDILAMIGDIELKVSPTLTILEWAVVTATLKATVASLKETEDVRQGIVDSVEEAYRALDAAISEDIKRRYSQCKDQ